MKFSGRGEAEQQFQIAPMLDIVFILLIWLIVSMAVAEEERMLNINLPEAGDAASHPRMLNDIVVDINATGGITHMRRSFTPAQLEERLRKLVSFALSDPNREPGVIIRADGDCPHRFVVRVMDVCKATGIRRTFFSTITQKEDRE